MNAKFSHVLKQLVEQHCVAALGTIDNDVPFVSMVPYALSADAGGLIIHVSRLAAHTQNMERNGNVSLMIAEAETRDKMPQALARVTIQGRARAVTGDDGPYEAARRAYLLRFPDAAGLFEFPDFRLILVEPVSIRLVSGFAQAVTLSSETFFAAFLD